MDWVQMMVFAATRPSYLFASSHEGVPDDGTRSCPVDAGTSSYVYDGGGYDESGLTYLFSNVVHAADQPLWDLQPISIRILPSNHTLPGDYYKTKKLVKDLGLPVEKIHACKNGYMLYWKDDIDLEYCKFCRDEEPRNIRLGLCTDGFVPHGQYGHAVQVSLGRSSLRHEGAPKLSPR
ncbi:UNVERIFIED_CONTAM: hypothetical protein Scaly_2993700 [Sesamum calycinum]|uniref:Uncharacterized protein n=1 Tax=Sesamum calycinum TaxID=2727403 RepID=A0AAW2KEE9_9LAMI